jgi:hypothetical protein
MLNKFIIGGPKQDMVDLCAAIADTHMSLANIIDSTRPFEKGEEAIQYVWQERQVGELMLTI